MAKVNQVSLCPKCRTQLPEPIPPTCPGCNVALKPSFTSPFASPDYLYFQNRDLQEQQTAGKKDPELPEKAAQKLLLEKELWLKQCPDEDRIAALDDAWNMLSYIANSNASADTIKSVIRIGKRIGELASALDAYAIKGGKFNVARFSPTPRPEDSEQDLEPA